MSNQVTQVFATTSISFFDMMEMPKDKLTYTTRENLIRGLSSHIIEHIEDLPVAYSRECEFNTYSNGVERITIRVNLISDEELTRLRSIENELNILKFERGIK